MIGDKNTWPRARMVFSREGFENDEKDIDCGSCDFPTYAIDGSPGIFF